VNAGKEGVEASSLIDGLVFAHPLLTELREVDDGCQHEHRPGGV